jgi:hypothetical protein
VWDWDAENGHNYLGEMVSPPPDTGASLHPRARAAWAELFALLADGADLPRGAEGCTRLTAALVAATGDVDLVHQVRRFLDRFEGRVKTSRHGHGDWSPTRSPDEDPSE